MVIEKEGYEFITNWNGKESSLVIKDIETDQRVATVYIEAKDKKHLKEVAESAMNAFLRGSIVIG